MSVAHQRGQHFLRKRADTVISLFHHTFNTYNNRYCSLLLVLLIREEGLKSRLSDRFFFCTFSVRFSILSTSRLQLQRHLSLISPCGRHPLNKSCDVFSPATSSAMSQILQREQHGGENGPQAILDVGPPRGAQWRRGFSSTTCSKSFIAKQWVHA